MISRALILLLLVLNAGVAAWWAFAPAAHPESPEPPTTAPRLQLVGEVRQNPPNTVAVATGSLHPGAPAQAAPASPPASSRCWRFGPFDAAALATAHAWLQPRVARASDVSVPASGRGWRVWLPPLPDRDTAQAMAGQIVAAGITDYYVVPTGAEANSIALGRYGNEDAARRRQAALQAAGFGAQAEALGASTRWVEVAAEPDFDAAAARTAIAAAHVLAQDCPRTN